MKASRSKPQGGDGENRHRPGSSGISPGILKSCPATWDGHLVLACRKCQKKLKGNHELAALAKLKKSIKQRNKQHPDTPLHLLDVPCLDLCPKNAVTVVLPHQPDRLSILRSESDIDQLYASLDEAPDAEN